jgi:hypothetical protein
MCGYPKFGNNRSIIFLHKILKYWAYSNWCHKCLCKCYTWLLSELLLQFCVNIIISFCLNIDIKWVTFTVNAVSNTYPKQFSYDTFFTFETQLIKLRSHLPTAEPRTIPVSYRDDPGRSVVKLLLRSHLPRQHYGSSQLTTKDALRIIQAEPRWSYGSCRCFPGRSRMTPEEPRLTKAEPRSIQAELRQSRGRSRQSPGRTPVDCKRPKMITLIHNFYLI